MKLTFFSLMQMTIMFNPYILQGPRENVQINASFKYKSLLLHCDRGSWRRHPGRVSGASDSAQTTFWLRVSAAQMMKGVKTRQSTTSLSLLGQCQLPHAAISQLHNTKYEYEGSQVPYHKQSMCFWPTSRMWTMLSLTQRPPSPRNMLKNILSSFTVML